MNWNSIELAPKNSINPVERVKKPLLLVLFLSGSMLVADGLYIKSKAILAQYLLSEAWAETIETNNPVKAWSWADTYPVAEINIPGRSPNPTIALRGSSGEALAFAPGHLINSASPGQRGTVIYAAHRDTHFSYLQDVTKNDHIEVTDTKGQKFTYRIDQMRIASWDQSGLTNNNHSKKIALVTCWPFDETTPGPLRYIVEGTLID